MLSQRDRENTAGNYFQSKPASQIPANDPRKSLTHHKPPPGLHGRLSNNSGVLPTQAPERRQPLPFSLQPSTSPSPRPSIRKAKTILASGSGLGWHSCLGASVRLQASAPPPPHTHTRDPEALGDTGFGKKHSFPLPHRAHLWPGCEPLGGWPVLLGEARLALHARACSLLLTCLGACLPSVPTRDGVRLGGLGASALPQGL